MSSGHAWGMLLCPRSDKCTIVVWSTPKNPGNHAKQIRRKVDQCVGS